MFFSLMALIGVPLGLIAFAMLFVATQYKRCASNQVLVICGKIRGGKSSKCIHGGGAFVIPLIQDYTYMSLEPIAISVDLKGALSKKNIRVNVPSTFTVGISTKQEIMTVAAERLLNLREEDVSKKASDIIFGQLRQVIATMTIEEINADREKFICEVTESVGSELAKIGLEVINVNIINVTDESGYIEAIGQKAAAEAINQANVDVAQQDKYGHVGVATALRQKEVSVAEEKAQSVMGQKEAEKTQRVRVAALNADIVQGENDSQALVAATNASLAEKQAEAMRRGDVAKANAERDIFEAQKAKEIARLQTTELAKQEVEKLRIEVEAEAQAEKTRRLARGEADGILAKYMAEAEGTQKVLEAKAEGYRRLLEACGDSQVAANLLLIEKLADIVAIQVEALKNVKIDKLTVWEGAAKNGDQGALAGFLRDFARMTPPLHEIAEQAGIRLPMFMGTPTQAT
jgi:flotillin